MAGLFRRHGLTAAAVAVFLAACGSTTSTNGEVAERDGGVGTSGSGGAGARAWSEAGGGLSGSNSAGSSGSSAGSFDGGADEVDPDGGTLVQCQWTEDGHADCNTLCEREGWLRGICEPERNGRRLLCRCEVGLDDGACMQRACDELCESVGWRFGFCTSGIDDGEWSCTCNMGPSSTVAVYCNPDGGAGALERPPGLTCMAENTCQ